MRTIYLLSMKFKARMQCGDSWNGGKKQSRLPCFVLRENVEQATLQTIHDLLKVSQGNALLALFEPVKC